MFTFYMNVLLVATQQVLLSLCTRQAPLHTQLQKADNASCYCCHRILTISTAAQTTSTSTINNNNSTKIQMFKYINTSITTTAIPKRGVSAVYAKKKACYSTSIVTTNSPFTTTSALFTITTTATTTDLLNPVCFCQYCQQPVSNSRDSFLLFILCFYFIC